jgi:signal transduction histidine kinase
LQAGIAELKKERVDISSYLLEVLERFAYLQETQGYLFEVDIEEELYAVVDEIKIGQVLYNLIGNAVNYTGEDKKVFVSLKQTDEHTFRFAVRDTGKGIKQEELATIWDRYYRSLEMHKRPVQGTGLGLSIVKVVLEKHNLHFAVESAENQGSTFFVDFIIA